MISVAIIGFGYWGKILSKYLENSDKFNLKHILVRTSEGCNNKFITDISLIKKDKEISAVFIATPISTHFHLSKEMLNSRKHVFCEKPLSNNLEEVKELKKLSKVNNRIIYTNYIYTNSPSIKKLKNELSNYNGKMFFEGEIKQYGRFYKNESVFDIIGCHLLSIVCFLFPSRKFDIKHVLVNKEIFSSNFSKIKLSSETTSGILDVSLLSNEKIRKFIVYTKESIYKFDMNAEFTFVKYKNSFANEYIEETKYKFNEFDNLENALSDFYKCITENSSNLEISEDITVLLSDINKFIYKE